MDGVHWNKTYGNAGNESGWRLLRTLEGQLLLLTHNTSLSGNAYKQLVLTKLDTAGNILFNKVIAQGSDPSDGFDVVQLADSSFVVCGHIYHATSARWRAFAASITKNGAFIRAKTSTLPWGSEFWRVLRLAGGKLVFAGHTFTGGTNGSDFLFGISDTLLQMSCQHWINQTLTSVDAQLNVSSPNKLFQFTTGGTMNRLNWSLANASSGMQEIIINLNRSINTSLPTSIDRCQFDSLELDAGSGIQQYYWYSGERTRIKKQCNSAPIPSASLKTSV
jgi:hypothetical protein